MNEQVRAVETTPFDDQKPGTSGLRKKTRTFMGARYVENFVQSVINAVREEGGFRKAALVVGGDGRYYNRQTIQTIIRIAAANGFGRILVARGGILSTPAMSAVIRRRGAFGGFVLSASHNPGGMDGDFGIKYNARNGGPAPEALTKRIFEETRQIREFLWADSPDIDLDREGTTQVVASDVSVFDPLADYTTLLGEVFDFDALRRLFRGGFRMLFDAMHGVTGPYARHILEERLGAPPGTVLNGKPLEDFGGHHPDPNLVHAAGLVKRMARPGAPDFGAACDADGDRNLVLGRNFFVTPGDSLAIIAEHARCIPHYRRGLSGIARSMPTSTSADRVAEALGVRCYETPTGWKFFGNLMDARLCNLCGEESFGTGSDHVREKDGVWAVLAWLSILNATRKPVEEIVRQHWGRFGRSYFQRHDYESLDGAKAGAMLDEMRSLLPELPGMEMAGTRIETADDFSYKDPVDGSVSANQGIRLLLEGGSRLVFRLSGTGTHGATLRIYVERYDREDTGADEKAKLEPLALAVRRLLRLKERFGTDEPAVIT